MSETQEQQWFSTKVRLVCLIASIGAVRYMDVVYVFQGTDFQTAFKRAVELGKCQEKSYHNADGKEVVWKLVEILSLDFVQAESLDGAEVYSEPVWQQGNPMISTPNFTRNAQHPHKQYSPQVVSSMVR